jgi:acyl-CoA hydrolase
MKVFFISSPSHTLQMPAYFFAELRFFSHFIAASLQILRSPGRIASRRSKKMQMAPTTAVPTEEQTRFVEMVFPEQANHYGTLFGGHALSLMGKAAFIAATRRARQSVVMAASGKIEFHEPIRVGELVELVASIARVGRSSMTVAVDMIREDLISGRRKSAVRGTFEMVAVNASGRPVPIAEPTTITDIKQEATP